MNANLSSLPAAVVFDLDGTLIDSAPDLHAALNRLMASEKRRPLSLAEVVLMIGDGVPKLVERGYQATGEVPKDDEFELRVARFTADYEKRATELTSLFPGVMDALEALRAKNVQLGICTNKPQKATMKVLSFFGLSDMFDAVVGGDQLQGVRKPDARHITTVLEILNVAPADAIMVGDSPNDIYVAINAEVRSVAVSFGYTRIPVQELGANRVINHFDELGGAIAEIYP